MFFLGGIFKLYVLVVRPFIWCISDCLTSHGGYRATDLRCIRWATSSAWNGPAAGLQNSAPWVSATGLPVVRMTPWVNGWFEMVKHLKLNHGKKCNKKCTKIDFNFFGVFGGFVFATFRFSFQMLQKFWGPEALRSAGFEAKDSCRGRTLAAKLTKLGTRYNFYIFIYIRYIRKKNTAHVCFDTDPVMLKLYKPIWSHGHMDLWLIYDVMGTTTHRICGSWTSPCGSFEIWDVARSPKKNFQTLIRPALEAVVVSLRGSLMELRHASEEHGQALNMSTMRRGLTKCVKHSRATVGLDNIRFFW